ncbi:MAG: hypothetical protein P4L51_01620 [Puia sp.]|nr:hypothetical protein [Puia sp.]
MKRLKWLALLPAFFAGYVLRAQKVSSAKTLSKVFSTKDFSLTIDTRGWIMGIRSLPGGEDYVPKDHPGSLLQLVKGDRRIVSDSAGFGKDFILLFYPDHYTAKVKVSGRTDYLRFELVGLARRTGVVGPGGTAAGTDDPGVDAVLWGPFNTSLSDTIGNTVGIVRSAVFAIGLQTLNVKTTGGVLQNEEGAVFERGSTATKEVFGSSLQAFTVNRSHPRVITVSGWKNVPVEGIAGGNMEGSALAVFGCRNADVLPTISSIEKSEGLPHPIWRNEWIKQSEFPGHPYMISSFSEENIDTLLSYAKSMGLDGLYHEGPFSTWGSFELDKNLFPHGRAGFKACVDKAHALGLRLGFHTLTDFITTNDAYVTPKPNPHLAMAGSSVLAGDIGPADTEIPVQSPDCFTRRSDLNGVRIGDEIVRFREVSPAAPYRLLGCVRGAFGTSAAAHKKGDLAGRLIDHPYKVFFPDWTLQKEIASNIARFLNETGADQMDFDGHEGMYMTGMGNLALEAFAEDVYKLLKHPVVFGSSRSAHYFWHMNDYLNWGEPWYGGFRESQSDYRIDNQKFYEANYLPNMLGWFLITPQTKPEDVDWMLARAAGYNAGYALVVPPDDARNNPRMREVIESIHSWTEAQQKHAFSSSQRVWLKDTSYDAHLERAGAASSSAWKIYKYKSVVFEHAMKVLQPGQPTSSEWSFENKSANQSVQMVLLAAGKNGRIDHPVIELDNSFRVEIPVPIEAGQSLVIDGSSTAVLYDNKGRFVKNIVLEKGLPLLAKGAHPLLFDCQFSADADISVRIKVKLLETTEEVGAR